MMNIETQLLFVISCTSEARKALWLMGEKRLSLEIRATATASQHPCKL